MHQGPQKNAAECRTCLTHQEIKNLNIWTKFARYLLLTASNGGVMDFVFERVHLHVGVYLGVAVDVGTCNQVSGHELVRVAI